MELEFIIRGIIIGLLASIPLGPIGVLCIQRTINKGQKYGFASGMGAAISDTIFAAIAGFSLSFIINFIDEQRIIFQLVGGVVVLILGIKIFITNPVKQLRKNKRKKSSLFEDFISVFFLTLSNPLAIFLFIGFIAAWGGSNSSEQHSIISTIFLLIGVLLGGMTWWFSLTWIVNRFRKKFGLKQLWWINKITGLIIGIIGIAAFASAYFI